ncbi:hypothetical protein HID58_047187, partial [Brassica napus]
MVVFTTLDKGCCGIGRNRAHISLVFPMRHLVLTKFEISYEIYLNIAHMFDEIIANPASYGFTTLDKGCCEIGRSRAHISLVFPMRHL